MTERPYIVYLDQNKWIELARAAKKPDDFPAHYQLLESIVREAKSGRLLLPLTAANIYETQKINDPKRRQELAYFQATASQGLVFRGRHMRLEAELNDFWCAIYERPAEIREMHWFLSNIFFEAFAEWGDVQLTVPISENIIGIIRSDPPRHIYEFLVATPEDVRRAAVRNFSEGSDQLRQRIEERRRQHAGENLAMRRRIQSANLMINEMDLILTFASRAGFPWKSIGEMGEENVRQIVEDVPSYYVSYYVEREIALRLEAQARPIQENDFRDMQSFCTVIPYADHVVSENQFINLARQAKLDKKYRTQLSTNILDLAANLDGSGSATREQKA